MKTGAVGTGLKPLQPNFSLCALTHATEQVLLPQAGQQYFPSPLGHCSQDKDDDITLEHCDTTAAD